MKTLLTNRLFLLAVLFAIIFIVLSYLNNTHSEKWPESIHFLKYLLYKIQLPALLVGIFISNNVHQPNGIAFYSSLFIMYFVIFVCLITVFKLIYLQTSKDDKKRKNAIN